MHEILKKLYQGFLLNRKNNDKNQEFKKFWGAKI